MAICFCFSSALQACVLSHTHTHIDTLSRLDIYRTDLFAKVIVTRTPQKCRHVIFDCSSMSRRQQQKPDEEKEEERNVTQAAASHMCACVCVCARFCILLHCIDLLWPSQLPLAPFVSFPLSLSISLCLLLAAATCMRLDKFKLRN